MKFCNITRPHPWSRSADTPQLWCRAVGHARAADGERVDKSWACVLARFFYAGGMRKSIFLKSFIIVGVAAICGAAFVALRHTSEVRGESEVQEPMPRAKDAPETLEPAHEEAEDWRAYMLGLSADDYATFTHPVYGFSFDYPKAFALLTDHWGDEEVIELYHPRYALGIRVAVRPLDMRGELVSELKAMPESYTQEAPEGADSTAVGWMDQDVPAAGEYTAEYWFAKDGRLYELQLRAPDPEWLEGWLHGFVHEDLTLAR
jgi:hypothetical protein